VPAGLRRLSRSSGERAPARRRAGEPAAGPDHGHDPVDPDDAGRRLADLAHAEEAGSRRLGRLIFFVILGPVPRIQTRGGRIWGATSLCQASCLWILGTRPRMTD